MGAAVPLRTDFSAGELRQLAKRAEDVDQARRLLSLAAVLDGQNRKVAAEIGATGRRCAIGCIASMRRAPRGSSMAKLQGRSPSCRLSRSKI